MFEHRLPPLEILSEESLETLERGWMRLVSEIGIEFLHDGACDLFRAAGQRVEDQVVFLDPDFVLEQLRAVPRRFTLQGRNYLICGLRQCQMISQ